MSGGAVRLAAQAKINLALQVGPRGDDGYHDVATLLARIDLADDVTVRITGHRLTIDVRGPAALAASVGPSEDNLATRAARAYQRAAGWPDGCVIEIDKRIPVGAGLGGGSADAGAVLRALDALAPRPLGVAQLLSIARSLGADVPFCTATTPLALGTGRGDILETVPTLPDRPLVLLFPRLAVSTVDAYRWLDEHRERRRPATPPRAPERLRDAAGDWAALALVADNDFHDVVAARHPAIAHACSALRDAGAHIALMSGSGSAVFGVFAEAPDIVALGRACDMPAIAGRVPARVVGVERSE